MVAAHGSRHDRNEQMRDKEQPMVAISTGASVGITAGGAVIIQSRHYLQKHNCGGFGMIIGMMLGCVIGVMIGRVMFGVIIGMG